MLACQYRCRVDHLSEVSARREALTAASAARRQADDSLMEAVRAAAGHHTDAEICDAAGVHHSVLRRRGIIS